MRPKHEAIHPGMTRLFALISPLALRDPLLTASIGTQSSYNIRYAS